MKFDIVRPMKILPIFILIIFVSIAVFGFLAMGHHDGNCTFDCLAQS